MAGGPPGGGAPGGGVADLIQSLFSKQLSMAGGADPKYGENQIRQLRGQVGSLINHYAMRDDGVSKHLLKAMGAFEAALKELEQHNEKLQQAQAIQFTPAGPPAMGAPNPMTSPFGAR